MIFKSCLAFICFLQLSFYNVYNTDFFIHEVPPNIYKLAVSIHDKLHNHNNIITIIDFSEPSTAKRLWVVDLNTNQVLINTYVAHGHNSGTLYATSFSNAPGSLQSSIGVSMASTTYYGKHGLSRRILGLSEGYNTNELRRAIVIHGAKYIGNGKEGRSDGCFAVPLNEYKQIVNTISYGSLIIAYSPSSLWNQYN